MFLETARAVSENEKIDRKAKLGASLSFKCWVYEEGINIPSSKYAKITAKELWFATAKDKELQLLKAEIRKNKPNLQPP